MQFLLPCTETSCQESGKCNDHTIIKPPSDVIPCRSMPDTYNEEHDQIRDCNRNIASDLLAKCLPAAVPDLHHEFGKRQRIEHIILHPCSKCNMPAVPEIRNGCSEKRAFEILIQIHAEHIRHTEHDIDTSGEIAIQLDGIKQHTERRRTRIFVWISKDCIAVNCRPVRKHHLLEKAPENTFQTILDIMQRPRMPFIKLIGKCLVSANRSLQKLWKKCYKKSISANMVFCRNPLPVHVEQISDCLKCIVRDS